jgi:hypothetical protein
LVSVVLMMAESNSPIDYLGATGCSWWFQEMLVHRYVGIDDISWTEFQTQKLKYAICNCKALSASKIRSVAYFNWNCW